MRAFKFNDLDILPSFFAAVAIIDLINGQQISSNYPLVKIAYVVTPVLALISLVAALVQRRRPSLWVYANILWLTLWLAGIGFLAYFTATYKW